VTLVAPTNRRPYGFDWEDIGRLLAANLEQVLGWADHLVLAQKQSETTMEMIRNSGLPVTGLVNGSVHSSPAGPALSRAGD